MEVEANRAVNIGGVSYSPGDTVDISKLTEHKVHQLLRQRILRPKTLGMVISND
jgi:hypothetical protein